MKAKGDVAYMKFLVPRRADGDGDEVFPSLEELKSSVTSLAEMLGQVGYKTARFGKWHLGVDTQGFHISDSTGRGTGPGGRHHSDVDVEESLTDASIKFIQENKDGPFFLYLCHWDVHSPIVAREYVSAKYQEKLAQGTWSREWNPTYAAMIEAVDTSVGRIQRALQETGLDKNTLMIFTSDNGGWAPVTWNAPLKAAKGSFYEGGIRVPACMSWPGVITPGTTCEVPVTGVDYLPTFAEIAGAPLPESQPVDGRSFMPLLRGEEALSDRAIFWHYPLYLDGRSYNQVIPVHGTDTMYWRATPCSVIRRGDSKLIEYFEDQSVELFNIRRDIGEEHDLSDSDPQRVMNLLDELRAWQQEIGAVIPATPNPDFQIAVAPALSRALTPSFELPMVQAK